MEELLKQILAELKKTNETQPVEIKTFMSPQEFAEYVSLPERLIRVMVRQGQLPHVRPHKSHIHIDVAGGIEALRKHAGKTAEEIAFDMPVPVKIVPAREKKEKPKGRSSNSKRLTG